MSHHIGVIIEADESGIASRLLAFAYEALWSDAPCATTALVEERRLSFRMRLDLLRLVQMSTETLYLSQCSLISQTG